MKTFTCVEFNGYYPVGTAAVVAAKDSIEAADVLNAELVKIGLIGDVEPTDMVKFPIGSHDRVRILNNGDY